MPQWAPTKFSSTAYARSTEQRLATARAFVATLGLRDTPVLVDSISDELENRYEARPERLYVVQHGKVLWRGGLGPFDYDAAGLAAFLEAHS
jgi:type I thyroxine 5'-deiodinase